MELEQKLNEYYEKFGVNYPMLISQGESEEQVIRNIEYCLYNNVKRIIEYDNKDVLY